MSPDFYSKVAQLSSEGQPFAIANFNFEVRENPSQNYFRIGDSQALITPLCGNGMSMAFHSAQLLAQQIEISLQLT